MLRSVPRSVRVCGFALALGAAGRALGEEPPPPAVPAPVRRYLESQEQQSEDARLQRERTAQSVKQMAETRETLSPERVEPLQAQARVLLKDVQTRYQDRRPSSGAADFDWLPEIQRAQKAYQEAGGLLEALRAAVEKLQRLDDVEAAARGSDQAKALASQVLALLDERDRRIDAASESIKRLYLRNHALVISGGVSLGNYQAGFLYYYTLYLKSYVDRINALRPRTADADSGRFKIGTGASAGSINALLALIVGCLPPDTDPEHSPFFTVWHPVGIRELAQPADVRGTGILSRRAIEAAVGQVGQLLDGRQRFPEHCRSILGITATRVRPRSIEYSDQAPDDEPGTGGHATIELQRQNEKFVLALDMSAAAGADFRTHRLAIASDPFVAEVYPTLGDHRGQKSADDLPIARANVMSLIQGSAAFPVAFPPVPIPTTIWRKSGPAYELPLYTDGGFVDNTPLDLAYKIATSGQVQGAVEPPVLFLKADAVLWRPRRPDLPPPPVFGRPATAPEPPSPSPPPPAASAPESIFALFLPFLFELVSGASDGQLTESLEKGSVKKLERRIPGRRMPVTGDFLGHFGAFLDQDFRRFDFYQGMADAHDFLGERSGNSGDRHIVEKLDSRTFTCFHDYRQRIGPQTPVPAPPPSCQGVSSNLLALLQTSAEHMKAVTPRTTPGQEFEGFFDGLYRRGFRYTALADGQPLDAQQVQVRLRDTVQELAGPLRSTQGDEVSKLGASFLGKTFPNELVYRPASYWALGFIQGVEVSRSWVLHRRPRAALKVAPILRYMSPSQVWPSFDDLKNRVHSMEAGASAQLQAELAPLSALQVEGGLGWGGRLRLQTFNGTVPGLVPRDWMMWRHGPEWSLSLVAYQRLYLTYTSIYYLDKCAFANGCAHVNPSFRRYAQPLATSRFEPHLSLGWRFLY